MTRLDDGVSYCYGICGRPTRECTCEDGPSGSFAVKSGPKKTLMFYDDTYLYFFEKKKQKKKVRSV